MRLTEYVIVTAVVSIEGPQRSRQSIKMRRFSNNFIEDDSFEVEEMNASNSSHGRNTLACVDLPRPPTIMCRPNIRTELVNNFKNRHRQ